MLTAAGLCCQFFGLHSEVCQGLQGWCIKGGKSLSAYCLARNLNGWHISVHSMVRQGWLGSSVNEFPSWPPWLPGWEAWDWRGALLASGTDAERQWHKSTKLQQTKSQKTIKEITAHTEGQISVWKPQIVQVDPFKMIRKVCNFHFGYTTKERNSRNVRIIFKELICLMMEKKKKKNHIWDLQTSMISVPHRPVATSVGKEILVV